MNICDACIVKMMRDAESKNRRIPPHSEYFGPNNERYREVKCEVCGLTKDCVERPDLVSYSFTITKDGIK